MNNIIKYPAFEFSADAFTNKTISDLTVFLKTTQSDTVKVTLDFPVAFRILTTGSERLNMMKELVETVAMLYGKVNLNGWETENLKNVIIMIGSRIKQIDLICSLKEDRVHFGLSVALPTERGDYISETNEFKFFVSRQQPSDLSCDAVDTLVALVEHGPLWDGDVPSKSGRDKLITAGLAIRVVVKGEDGYTAATYQGRDAYKKEFGTALGGGADTVAEAKANRLTQRVLRNV